ncbi:hypothetical protein [Pseudaminobacter soli (ex Li et al. 2025)]|uniref:Uncharacterized protein n=1 Tax=Pseudaminobacter soli (ex Li et al. 2025) TaxID=1295366 RepID=A0A2P7RMJ9_9HYPH|nr:hypothetical protein [Mesorhizobium soli]PSJ51429.1 hypothetical protein C7I85_29450 [Mesorhizobium soli]
MRDLRPLLLALRRREALKYLSHNPHQGGPRYPEELDRLDELVRRAAKSLHIVDADERAARILSLYSMGKHSLEEILEVAVHLHRQGSTILTPKWNRAPA